ncbi:kinase-like protein [Hyaloscypha variabilis F]|uniref:non-specific serine/threonine protein kinase n=1 Tax=Hyaloscypha variabilis (strain UAMH 11265 / GT02V1 / F) TaxID=1149755 RepID=A0A2J6S5R0_HYAVF|nr:kinase-like protein [Hyaloscypha variabilis F]
MDHLQVQTSDRSSVKVRALEDARQMQAAITVAANKAGKAPPKYVLDELIGRGSFGRVYRGKDTTTAGIVAVKIIDIDQSDTVSPRNADSFNEFLKEITALKTLSENRARNINHVIEALLVGQTMWMITEYCGGGSVATLMKPTSPGGLQEKWIIPILREVAEAVKWVHQAGIIHRDIKCANVLITEQGGVQLCDFGVAGTIETKLDKRSTFIGTLHWMAPELFESTPSYSKEVDIWAFGSMAYEIATGLPPNVTNDVSYERLGTHLRNHPPRLEAGNYSKELRSLISYCLEELPSSRPAIEQVQKHPYIYNTDSKYPTPTLSHLVRAFRLWEDHGGSRKSLFMPSGAQGHTNLSSTSLADDEWNFSTTIAFDQKITRESTAQDVYEAYGRKVELTTHFAQDISHSSPPQERGSRRRPPPEALARLRAPLEKVFDPNTLSNYHDNSLDHYNQHMQQPKSDLPLRDDSAHTSIRDTMIDLGDHDSDNGGSNILDLQTIKAEKRSPNGSTVNYASALGDFTRPAHSDPEDNNSNRHTKDWKFPAMAPPASADPIHTHFTTTYELPESAIRPSSSDRPTLIHRATEPISNGFEDTLMPSRSVMNRMSMRDSLIDLDMSMPDTMPKFTTSEEMKSGNPFELERHVSLDQPIAGDGRRPPICVTEDLAAPAEMSDFSVSDGEGDSAEKLDGSGFLNSEYLSTPPPPTSSLGTTPVSPGIAYTISHLPSIPPQPSVAALYGTLSHSEMANELTRLIGGMMEQLEAFRDVYSSLP